MDDQFWNLLKKAKLEQLVTFKISPVGFVLEQLLMCSVVGSVTPMLGVKFSYRLNFKYSKKHAVYIIF